MPVISRYVLLAGWLLSGAGLSAHAATLEIKINDQNGQPLENAVVELVSTDSTSPIVNNEQAPGYKMVQQNKAFAPFVLAVPRHAAVDFPNLDSTRHHVYSFSPAKTFEIKLYKGKPHAPVVFDKPGVVALGCNIHDNMQGHIYVSDSSNVAVADSLGSIRFTGLDASSYQIKLWHPWQKETLAPKKVHLDGVPIHLVLPVNKPAPTLSTSGNYPRYN